MKTKTIKAVLRKTVDAWLASIEDESVRALAKTHTIVTGGCIASMLLQEKVNDFDIYFTNHETTLAVARYYAARFKPLNVKGIPTAIFVADGSPEDVYARKAGDYADDGTHVYVGEKRVRIVVKSAGIASEDGTTKEYQYFEARPADEAAAYVADVIRDPADIEDAVEEIEARVHAEENTARPKFRPVFLSTNAITLSDRIQIVLRFYGEPDHIHENFDFAHCTSYWEASSGALTLRPAALETLLTKELRYVGSKYPVCSLIRVRKFLARGWTINAGQIVKMCMQMNELDLLNVKVLQDQLTGVDVAYFCQLIDAVKDGDPAKVNTAYIVEIIDRLF